MPKRIRIKWEDGKITPLDGSVTLERGDTLVADGGYEYEVAGPPAAISEPITFTRTRADDPNEIRFEYI